MNSTVLFLDVDGSILCAPEHSDNTAAVMRTINQPRTVRTSEGNMATVTRMFEIETEIFWRNSVVEFFRANPFLHVVWLTGWEHNAEKLKEFFPVQNSEVLLWNKTEDESGKKTALHQWLTINAPVKFIWVDDVATKLVEPDEFTIPHLIVTPDVDEAVSDSELTRMQNFLNVQ